MATLTLKLPAAEGRAAASAPTRGFWRGLYRALVEARTRQAELELKRFRHFIPADPVKEAGYRVGLKGVSALPFVR